MADYIYTMEIRFTPDQQKGAAIVQEIARAAGMNLYLVGGTMVIDSRPSSGTRIEVRIPVGCQGDSAAVG